MNIHCKQIQLHTHHFPIFLDCEIQWPQGQTVLHLRGPSGAGKSQFLHLLMGLKRPEQGQLVVNGETWASAQAFLPPHKRPVALMFQKPLLFPHLTVKQNLNYVQASAERCAYWSESCGIIDLLEQYPHALSGGEQQRVALVRSLLKSELGDRLLLLDEPFSALNPAWRLSLAEMIVQHLHQFELKLLLASHDAQIQRHWPGEDCLFIDRGKIEFGKLEDFDVY